MPPHNLPNRWIRRGALGLYQTRNAKRNTMDVPKLLDALTENGYGTCRLLWRSVLNTVADWIRGNPTEAFPPSRERGILTFRLNSSGGFGKSAYTALDQAARTGATATLYAHPHSLVTEGPQHISQLEPFLKHLSEMRKAGSIRVCTAEQILREFEK